MLQPLVATETVSYLAAVVLTEAFGWLVGFLLFIETGSHLAQAGLNIARALRLALNS